MFFPDFMESFGMAAPPPARPLQWKLECFSMAFFPGADSQKINELNFGGKIMLPSSVLNDLSRRNISYPMAFKLNGTDPAFRRSTYAGVLEFSAAEGKAYLPQWMMDQIHLLEGDMLSVESVDLPTATYAKLKPKSVDFLSVPDPRGLLEAGLCKYTCLTKGDFLSVQYDGKVMHFKIMDLKPTNSGKIIDCDLNVDFDPPDGYVEPKPVPKVMPEAPLVPLLNKAANNSFSGAGMSLNGTPFKAQADSASRPSQETPNVGRPTCIEELPAIVPDESYKAGRLEFVRYNYRNHSVLKKELPEKKNEPSATKTWIKATTYKLR